MVTQNWLYDAILYIYALSLLFYFSDFMNASRRAKRMGTGLLIFVWVLQTGYLVIRMVSHLQMTTVTPFEYWLGFSWLLVTISLVISRFIQINFIVFFVNVIGFAVLALNLYSNPGDGESLAVWDTTRELLYIHISLVLCAYAALTIGALFAGMYLVLHNQLKRKRWSSFVRRLPSLDLIERYGDRAVIIGVPLLAMSLAIAVTSLLVEGRTALLLDWKVLSSFATLIMYIIYVYQRAMLRRPGLQLARLYMFAFGMLILNLLSNYFSSFH
ncbi:cytochrome c biogenesis protein CcsA [Paenibacillus alkaliterrae]|uniref:cytochrome c biogenesis protein CcsA n=1 Tax=Paenibacillus alkaliterrae TaxID=320909 RepID=UPI001F3C5625|nr:cytochrome c biogenesis protein CcsA [Paenibacillus alkaliterrae]MCF2937319.1 cytochrome c biogenesis protein CcsA [Paenibacillus alkaliterrae]